jgi:hypothetical protein
LTADPSGLALGVGAAVALGIAKAKTGSMASEPGRGQVTAFDRAMTDAFVGLVGIGFYGEIPGLTIGPYSSPELIEQTRAEVQSSWPMLPRSGAGVGAAASNDECSSGRLVVRDPLAAAGTA